MLKNGYLAEEEFLKHCKSNSNPVVRSEMASSKHDVIIIGAGLSGLSAATRLKIRCPDLDVLVLESGDRIGGRTYSVDITAPDGTNDVLDLGAHWVGSTQKEVLEVMRQYGVDCFKQNIDGETASSFNNHDKEMQGRAEVFVPILEQLQAQKFFWVAMALPVLTHQSFLILTRGSD